MENMLTAVVLALSRTKNLVFIYIVVIVLHDVLWKAVGRRVRGHEAGEVLEIEAVDKKITRNVKAGVRYCRNDRY